MGSFSASEAEIVALFLQTLFYGFFLVTAFQSVQSLLFDEQHCLRKSGSIKWLMLAASLLLFFFATMDVFLAFSHDIKVFIFTSTAHGTDEAFRVAEDWTVVMRDVDLNVQTSIGDGVLLYRCWVVYGHRWQAILASGLLWMANIALGIVMIYFIAKDSEDHLYTSPQLQPVTYAWWAITIALNILTTGMIVYRIRAVETRKRRYRVSGLSSIPSSNGSAPRSTLSYAMRLIIESGLLYTLVALLTFILILAKSNALYPVSDVLVQVVGIAFNLIIVRASNRRAENVELPLRSGSTAPRNQNISLVVMESTQRTRGETLADGESIISQKDEGVLVTRHVSTMRG